MCGICGTKGIQDRDLLQRMTETLSHRGPDSDGYYLDEQVSLGVRRLRIIDLVTGDQPMHNEDSSIIAVLNGEIYNYKELTAELKGRGHRFYTNSDTEVLVHLYEDFGEDFMHKLRGMFAFAIWDKRDSKLFLARDRLGIKPLYYIYKDNKFMFASEMRALLEDKSISRELNPIALDYYLSFLYIPAPLSVLKSIKKLMPGHSLSLKNGSLDIRRYWRLDFLTQHTRSDSSLRESMFDVLTETMKTHLVSDVPLGVFLSGGIDSSLIVALLAKSGIQGIKTFSIGYEDKYSSYDELKYARLVSGRFGTQHEEFVLRPDIKDALTKVINYLDEPLADSSAILNYLISKEASCFVKVALSGVGGDELFGGYPRYIGAKMALWYQRLPHFLRQAMLHLSKFIPESTKSRNAGGRIKRFLREGLTDEFHRYINWMMFFDKQMKDGLYSPDLRNSLKNHSPESMHKQFFAQCPCINYLDRISYLDINTYLPSDLLMMADKMSMANSLELRVPFCDHKLVEFMATIDFNLKIKGMRLKGLLKDYLKGVLPGKILHKPKQGFMLPMGDWIKNELKDYITDILSKDTLEKRGLFNYGFVNKLLEDHFRGRGVYTHHIYALFIFELWLRNTVDKR
jgi:asparagine synthase (glutamine-hydrolysing)